MSDSGKDRRLGNNEIWAAPVLLALITCIGLVAALLADGAGDWLSWISLFVPVLTITVCVGMSYHRAARNRSLLLRDTKVGSQSRHSKRPVSS